MQTRRRFTSVDGLLEEILGVLVHVVIKIERRKRDVVIDLGRFQFDGPLQGTDGGICAIERMG